MPLGGRERVIDRDPSGFCSGVLANSPKLNEVVLAKHCLSSRFLSWVLISIIGISSTYNPVTVLSVAIVTVLTSQHETMHIYTNKYPTMYNITAAPATATK